MNSRLHGGICQGLVLLGMMACGSSEKLAIGDDVGGANASPTPGGSGGSGTSSGGGATASSAGSSNSEAGTNVAGGLQGTGGATANGNGNGTGGAAPPDADPDGPNASSCEPSRCAAVDVDGDGALEPGCCAMNGSCGGEFDAMGNTFCVPTGGFTPIQPEPIVPDARCATQTLPNPQTGATITLAGCCDASGICGIVTPAAVGDAGPAIVSCLTPADLAGFGFGADAGAGAFAEVSCN